MKTPILFLIFNRPDTTSRVFEMIRKQQPETLFIAADGPRADKPVEAEKCEQTRNIVNAIDWPCDVKTLFRDKNLGCEQAVSGAIDWFFQQVEEGIILEDDCLPNDSFFTFCETLLEKYRYDTRIGHISGNNFQNGITRGSGSYYFSRYNHIWGWASWRRAWKFYDVDMKTYPAFRNEQRLQSVFSGVDEQKFWNKFLDIAFKKGVNTWDYQWTYANWSQNMLSILPNVNLISNIGFGEEATHTNNSNDSHANMKTTEISGSIKHPDITLQDKEADDYTFKHIYGPKGILSRIKSLYNRRIKL